MLSPPHTHFLIWIILFWMGHHMSAQCPPGTYVAGSGFGIHTLTEFQNTYGTTHLIATDVTVRGTFDIDAGMTWTLDGVTVYLDGSAQIRVLPNASMVAQASSFADCGSPWKEIYVSTNARLIADACQFSGSNHQAVQVVSLPQEVRLTNNTFTGNSTDLRINGIQNPLQHTIFNNNFVVKGIGTAIANASNVVIAFNNYNRFNLNIPTIGIQVVLSDNIVIDQPRILNQSIAVEVLSSRRIEVKRTFINDIYGVRGIIAHGNSRSLKITNNIIRVIEEGISVQNHVLSNQDEIAISNNLVSSRQNTTIRVGHVSGPSIANDLASIKILNNFINEVNQPVSNTYYGIEVRNIPDVPVLISQNRLSHYYIHNVQPGGIYVWRSWRETIIRDNVVDANFTGDMDFGIVVAESPNCLISGNRIDGGVNVMQRNIGIELTPQDIALCCNWVDDGQKGLYMLGPHDNCHIFNTTFRTHTEALFYDMVISQGAPQIHRGNDWSGANTTWDGYFVGNGVDAQKVKYWVSNNLLPNGLSKIFVTSGVPSDWFYVNDSTETVCNGTGPLSASGSFCDELPGGGDEITGNDEWAAGSLDESDYAVLRWISQRHLFGKLERNPLLLLHSPIIQNFYAGAQNSNISRFYAVDAGLAHLYDIPEDISEAYWALISEIDGMNNELLDLLELMASASPEELPALEAQRDAVAAQIATAEQTLATYEAIRGTAIAQRVANILTINAAIEPETTYEADEKTINELYLNALANGNWDFTVSEQAFIDAVAARCPKFTGPAVYKARMLQSYYRIPDWSESDCTPVAQRSFQKVSTAPANLRVYPNPASDHLLIEVSASLVGQKGHVFLHSLTGQQVFSHPLSPGVRRIALPIDQLANGAYFLLLHTENGQQFRQKVVVLR